MKRYKQTSDLFGQTLSVEAKWLDDGIVVEVYGGDRTHVGAICWAGHGQEIQCIRLEAHKEYLITEKWAPQLAAVWNTPVTMLCGIHYDGATREMLEQIVQRTDQVLYELSSWIPED